MGSGSSSQTIKEEYSAQLPQVQKRRQITEDDDDDDSNDEDSCDDDDEPSTKIIEYCAGDSMKMGSSSFSALCTNTGQLLVLKKIILQKRDNYQLIKYNIQQLCNFKHKNVKPILGWSQQRSQKYELYIIESYEFNHSLHKCLKTYCRFSQELAFCIFKQILLGLEYIHSSNQLHKNLKTSKILIDDEGHALLSGINILSQYKLTNYSAPECLEQLEYTKHSDIWSAGCILYELITQQEPWAKQGLHSIDLIKKKYKQKQLFFSENDNLNKDVLSILKLILQFDPQKRPSINHLLNLQLFQEQNKLSHLVKTVTKKDQKPSSTTVFNQVQKTEQVQNSGLTQLLVKEDQNAQFQLKEAVKTIENQVFIEFTPKQNSTHYTLTQANFYNLAMKQTKFGNTIMKTKHQEKIKEASKANSLFNLVNVLKTAKSEAESQLQSIRNDVPEPLENSVATLVCQNQQSETLLPKFEEETRQITNPTFQNLVVDSKPEFIAVEEQLNEEKEDVEIDGDLVFII